MSFEAEIEKIPKQKGFVYHSYGDFYGYQPMNPKLKKDDPGYCYYMESRTGEMLIGDRLPHTEEEAIQYCRCANIAYRQGLEDAEKRFKKALKEAGLLKDSFFG